MGKLVPRGVAARAVTASALRSPPWGGGGVFFLLISTSTEYNTAYSVLMTDFIAVYPTHQLSIINLEVGGVGGGVSDRRGQQRLAIGSRDRVAAGAGVCALGRRVRGGGHDVITPPTLPSPVR